MADSINEIFMQYLVAKKLITSDQMNEAMKSGSQAFASLVEAGALTAAQLADTLSDYYQLPRLELKDHEQTEMPRDLPDFGFVHEGFGVPISVQDDELLIAVCDPNFPDIQGVDASSELSDYTFLNGLSVKLGVVSLDQYKDYMENQHASQQASMKTISSHYFKLDEIEDTEVGDMMSASGSNVLDKDDYETAFGFDVNDPPIIKFVSLLILDAIKSKSSDIHFEPYEKYSRVRLRQDGILHEVAKTPIQLAQSVVARIKVMSNLDISETRKPQDGRFRVMAAKGKSIDFRVSTCPTLYGEKVVIRLLDTSATLLDLDVLGMEPDQKQTFLDAIKKAQGMVLVTGPTGSGKTVTLYTALGILNQIEKNISTVEDPVEINLEGINQVQVNNKSDMTFANALRAFLRQDPDIMMVGEIRDLETAEIATQAVQTGHLVLSTLHTNSAPASLVRLENMGVKTYNIASAVIIVLAQRLVRKLCSSCKVKEELSKDILIREGFSEEQIEKGVELYKAVGCEKCSGGYKGRIGIYEVMPISREMEEIILKGGSSSLELEDQEKKEGILTLRQAGILKVIAGITSLEELNRVTV